MSHSANYVGDTQKRIVGDYTVYFRYSFDPTSTDYMGHWHYGHANVPAADVTNIKSACSIVMTQERASMIGHVGDRGKVEFLHATNNIGPEEGIHLWLTEEDGDTHAGTNHVAHAACARVDRVSVVGHDGRVLASLSSCDVCGRAAQCEQRPFGLAVGSAKPSQMASAGDAEDGSYAK